MTAEVSTGKRERDEVIFYAVALVH